MTLEMEKFNINELAGATGLILGAVSGILVVIFKSRCYCKFRVGLSDNCNICMCERKPPPDPNESDEEGKEKQNEILDKEKKILKKENEILKRQESQPLVRQGSEPLVPPGRQREPEPEPEIEKLV
tara:strand:- start:5934 stop:6311 length:378 start_codon:yes stop_codon:yes gene_type:complete